MRSQSTPSTRRSIMRDPSHPLATSRGYVLRSRLVLYNAIGPGPHPCALCDTPLEWRLRSPRHGDLCVDHIDEDVTNDTLGNLRPTCVTCNATRSQRWKIQAGEDFIVHQGGKKRVFPVICVTCGTTVLRQATTRNLSRPNLFCSRQCSAQHRERHGVTVRQRHDAVRSQRPIIYGGTKLTDSAILDIRARIASGERVTEIARSYGISHSAISMIRSRKRWAHI